MKMTDDQLMKTKTSSTGYGAAYISRFVFTVMLAVTSLALSITPAYGALGHPLKATFGTISQPIDIAVDKTSGNVFVVDTGSPGNSVQIFGPEGGTPIGVGSSKIEGFNFPQGRAALAIDNSSASPSKGSLYVVDAGNEEVKKFTLNPLSEEYEQTGELPATAGDGETLGVAVNGAGNVFVSEWINNHGHPDGALYEFGPDGVEIGNVQFSESSPTLQTALSSLSFDSAGNLYAIPYGNVGLWKFGADASGEVDLAVAPTKIVDSPRSWNDIDIDQDTNTLYATVFDRVEEYDLSCLPGCPVIREFGVGIVQRPAGIAVSPLNGDIYVSDLDGHNVDLFGAGLSVLSDVETEPSSGVTLTSATLNGTISAAEGPPATCEFEYASKASFEAENFAGAESVPCIPAGAFTGAGQEAVRADLASLKTNTAYVYRLRGENENGPSFGEALTFATVGKPVISAGTVSAITPDGATIEAPINPNGGPGAVQATSYELEYVSDEEFQANGFANATKFPPGGASIGSGIEDVAASQKVSGLASGVPYHFRFVAENEAGQTIGSEGSFGTFLEAPAFSGCANESLRQALGSTGLSDCRAYEQVTPTDKNGAAPTWLPARYQATADGDGIAYLSHGGFPGTEGGQGFPTLFANRGASWSSRGVLPPGNLGAIAGVLGWSDDLSHAYLVQGPDTATPMSFLERDSATGALQPLAVEGGINLGTAYFYVGGAHDGSTVFFESEDKPSVFNTYVWNRTSGVVSLAGALPGGGAPTKGSRAGSAEAIFRSHIFQDQHAISRNGSRFFFVDAGTGQLYLRQNPSAEIEDCASAEAACTVQVSKSQRATPDPKGKKDARFWAATPDGSLAFFTSRGKLTDDATTGPNDEGNDLYRYDATSGGLLDLAPDSGDPAGADVLGVLGTSEDGSYVYFAANGVLADGASAGDCAGITPIGGGSGSCNLYLWHDGTTVFVTRLTLADFPSTSDSTNWRTVINSGNGQDAKSSRVSADGRVLLFRSQAKLTSYDNRGRAEFYRYSVADESLLCVSCNPTGIPPLEYATLQSTPSGVGNVPPAGVLSRNLSADGNRVFFETPDKLVAADTNGDQGCPAIANGGGAVRTCQDVYEWEAEGSGSCESDEQNGGCLYLISDGRSSEPVYFADADAAGDNVFFLTDRPLVGQDKDQIRDIYDARVGGGIASQSPSPPPVPCEGEACKSGVPTPPANQSPGSAGFSGPANPKPTRHSHKKKRHKQAKGKQQKKKKHSTRKSG